MRKTIQAIQRQLRASKPVAVATVVSTAGSVPRPLGAKLVVTAGGDFSGSVSGGCVENAVIQTAEQVLRDGQAVRLSFGISPEASWEVGLACGGTIDVLVQCAQAAIWDRLARIEQTGQGAALLTVTSPGDCVGAQTLVTADSHSAPNAALFADAILAAQASLSNPAGQAQTYLSTSGLEILIEPVLPPPLLLIFGGVEAAGPLCHMAQMLNFQVVIADPRRRFANRERFPSADEIMVAWPRQTFQQLTLNGQSAVVILTHDPKIDEPALLGALKTDAFYIGAIGSRKTHAERFEQLQRQGMTAAQLERIHSPVGLDIGGQDPAELALSILSEIMAVRYGRSASFLRTR